MRAFKGRHFSGEVVLWAVRWYCWYGISYRDLETMLAEHGVLVDHFIIYRWVQKYAPEIGKRMRWQWRCAMSGGWRVDETYIEVRGKWTYRAADKLGSRPPLYWTEKIDFNGTRFRRLSDFNTDARLHVSATNHCFTTFGGIEANSLLSQRKQCTASNAFLILSA